MKLPFYPADAPVMLWVWEKPLGPKTLWPELAGLGRLLVADQIQREGQSGAEASQAPVTTLRQTQQSPEGPRHLHRIPRLSEASYRA